MKYDDEFIRGLQAEVMVPEVVYNKAQEAFQKIKAEGRQNQRKRISYKKLAVSAAVAVLAFATLTAGAFAMFKWNANLADKMQVSSTQQQKLAQDGTTQPVKAEDTQNGITVKAVQTIVDDTYAYMLFSVSLGDALQVSENMLFGNVEVSIDGKTEGFSWSGSVLEGTGDNEELEYQIQLVDNLKGGFQGSAVHVGFTDMVQTVPEMKETGKTDIMVEGKWDLNWVMQTSSASQEFQVEQGNQVYGANVGMVTLSPLSVVVRYDNWERSIMDEPVINEDGTVSSKESYKEPPMLWGVKMKDGTVISDISGGPGYGGYMDETGNAYESSFGFGKIIEVEQVEGLLFGNPTVKGEGIEITEEDLIEVRLIG